jgi:hypothetical protein
MRAGQDFSAQDFSAHRAAAADLAPLARSRRRPRLWPWLLGGLMLLLAALAGTAALLTVGREALEGAVIHINGQRWDASALDVDRLGWGVFGITAGLVGAGLVVLLVVPLSVALGLAAAALGVGSALLVVLGVAALLLSPLWLALLLLWMLLRRARPGAAHPARV